MINENFTLTEQQVRLYLEKLAMPYPLEPTIENLKLLQSHHLLAIPYENLNLLYGLPISLDGEALFTKIIQQGHGGFCFELNALYQWLLKALGYQVTSYYTRLIALPAEEQLNRHRLIRVDFANASYITDVGIRIGLSREALKLEAGLIQTDGFAQYRFLTDDVHGWVMQQKQPKRDWQNIFGFQGESQYEKDYIMATFFCEKHPDSPFWKSPQMSIFSKDGQVTIADTRLTVSVGSKITERYDLSEEGFRIACQTYFHIDLADFEK